ncbi:hypothetical protein [Leadbettera azotonutricia]|uniref:Putative lipoprotein n=1 Tax=Leadbettera azotonutricia (strain ATCC BAA-888 / DSM 13862 / ZAS-9) TaxID=545695 RepID=F5YBU6_LEAAZ|nr:hypothetical protein [Leadbettera azotonutricia]AEF81765.1 putative lipoprotein [Leadbettera azotonutricia ZAS-9]
MKKFFALSVLFAVLACGAFAQVNFGGSLYTGIELNVPNTGDESVGMRHREEGNTKLDLTGTVVTDNYGAKLDTTFVYPSPDNPRLNGIYGWANFLDNQLRLSLGKISDAVWVTSLDNEYKLDDVNGLRLEYKTPLTGLSVGVAFDAGDYKVEKFLKQTILGASYVTAYFNTVIAYDMGSNGTTIFGFNFTGIDELSTAGIELQASNMALWDTLGLLRVDEEAAYRVTRAFTASLHLGQEFSGVKNTDADLTFIPGLSYKIIPQLTASLDVKIESPDYFKTTNLEITPCLEYSLSGPALLYLQYTLALPEFKNPSHILGLGLEIKAF